MWTVLLSAGICYDTRLKIISPAVKVVEPCTDVSTEGKTNTRQYIYCGFTTLSDGFRVSARVCVMRTLLYIQRPPFNAARISISFIPLFASIRAPSEQYWLPVISKWSQLRFANSKAIWLIRALRLAIHHKSHPALRPINMQGVHLSWWT